MKAAVYNRYGPPDVVEIKALADPVPAPGQVLVRVEATTVCAPDWRCRRAEPALVRVMTGLTQPAKDKLLGFEFAGRIAALGDGVTRFAIGDPVFGSAGIGMGAHAELLCVTAGDNVQPRPENLTPAEAAAIPFLCLKAAGRDRLLRHDRLRSISSARRDRQNIIMAFRFCVLE